MRTNRFFVVAIKWDDFKKEQVKFIAGEFTDFVNAKLFKDAYDKNYSVDSRIISEYEAFN